MAARSLVIQYRAVPEPARSRYDQAWEELRQAAETRKAHAWRFVSANNPARFVEFLEFAAEADPRDDDAVRLCLRRMDDEVGRAEVEEWRDAG